MSAQTVARLVKQTPIETAYLYGENSPFSFSITHYKLNNYTLPVSCQQSEDCITLYFVYSGSFTISIQNDVYSVRAGQVVLLFENQMLSSGGVPLAKCEAYKLSFSPSAFLSSDYAFNFDESKAILKMLRQIPFKVFSTDRKKMHNCFLNMFLTACSTSEIGNTLMRNRFLTAITEVIKYANMPGRQPSPDIERVLTYIENNITEPLPIPALVKISHLSESRFKVKFAEYTGTSPHEYVLQKKIEEAKRLLADPKNSITQVCYHLSFSSSQYFATVFKRITAMRPSEYQNFCAINQYGHPWK